MIDEPFDEITEHEAQARKSLLKSRQHLTAGNLRKASKKGWSAATHIAKAVALAQGWQYRQDSHFHVVMNRLRDITGNSRIADLHGRAAILHCNCDLRRMHLDAGIIAEDLDKMAELVDLLSPLTGIADRQ